MVIVILDEVIVLCNFLELVYYYFGKLQVYDGFYMFCVIFFIGVFDIYDLEWGNDGFYVVNIIFFCLCKIDVNYNFILIW